MTASLALTIIDARARQLYANISRGRMFVNNHLRKRVHISHRQGGISVRIDRQNSRGVYFFGMCFCTMFFFGFCNIFIEPFRHRVGLPFVLPMLALGAFCYFIALAICVWGAFGIEEIIVEEGTLRWTRVALKWSRKLDIPVKDISEIKAITPWYGLDNTVEVVTGRACQTIGDKLLQDEAKELAHRLRGAVGLLR